VTLPVLRPPGPEVVTPDAVYAPGACPPIRGVDQRLFVDPAAQRLVDELATYRWPRRPR
jgi:hypothetical protein